MSIVRKRLMIPPEVMSMATTIAEPCTADAIVTRMMPGTT